MASPVSMPDELDARRMALIAAPPDLAAAAIETVCKDEDDDDDDDDDDDEADDNALSLELEPVEPSLAAESRRASLSAAFCASDAADDGDVTDAAVADADALLDVDATATSLSLEPAALSLRLLAFPDDM